MEDTSVLWYKPQFIVRMPFYTLKAPIKLQDILRTKQFILKYMWRTSLAVLWLRIYNAGGAGSIPGWGTKGAQALWHNQKQNKIIIINKVYVEK